MTSLLDTVDKFMMELVVFDGIGDVGDELKRHVLEEGWHALRQS